MTYIITDSLKNVNTLIRRENYAGRPSHGVESRRAVELAWEIVIAHHSKSDIFTAHLINDNTAAAVLLSLLKENSLFIPAESLCMATAKEVLTNINLLRANAYTTVSDSRVADLEKLIVSYEQKLKQLNNYDEVLAIKEAKALLEKGDVAPVQEEYKTCYFAKPSTLEREFVKMLNGGVAPADYGLRILDDSVESKSIDAVRRTKSFVSCYGIVNEVDFVAKTIIEKDYPFEDVEIICDQGIYEPFIAECFAKRRLPYSFSTGISMSGLDEVRLYRDLIKWFEHGCKYEELKPVMHNKRFCFSYEEIDNGEKKKVSKRAARAFMAGIDYGVGWGAERYLDPQQSSYAKQHNFTESEYEKAFRTELLPELGKLAQNLDSTTNCSKFFNYLFDFVKLHTFSSAENKYTRPRLENLRKNLAAINLEFETREELLDYLYGELGSLSYRREDGPASVLISSLKNVTVPERKHIFVIGLSSKEYDVSTAESPVFGDVLRKELFADPVSGCLSGNATLAEDNRRLADLTIKQTFAYATDNADITLIYSSADVMKDGSEVARSAFYESMMQACGIEGPEKETHYYEITTTATKIPYKYAWPSFKVEYDPVPSEIELKLSKTRLDELLGCPLKYHYDKELKINSEGYSLYDPGAWLAANEKGIIIHRVLEDYANNILLNKSDAGDFNEEQFEKSFELAKSEMLNAKAAPSEAILEDECEEYKRIIKIYLEWLHAELKESGWTVHACEYDIEKNSVGSYQFSQDGEKGSFDFDIAFSGAIDRIDRKTDEDGNTVYRIIDYKTGQMDDKKVKQTIQHLLYAWYVRRAFAQNGVNAEVEGFYYQSLKEIKQQLKPTETKIDDLTDDFLSDKKELLYKVYVQHDYLSQVQKDDKTEACRYCMYKDICTKTLLAEDK